jgi:hypothetical protein
MCSQLTLTKILLYNKYLFNYYRSKLKLVKEKLAKEEIPLDISSASFSPIFFILKIKKEKIKKPNNYLKKEFHENIKFFGRKKYSVNIFLNS